MYYIGVDLGTSAVKLILMDKEGNVVKTVSREYPLYFPKPGWSEQNPSDWYENAVEGIKELTDGVDAAQVAGISFGGQMHGLVILDKDNEVIRPAILWNDGRTTKECDYLNNTIGKDKIAEYTANIAFAGFTAPKILWLRENEPENFKKISKIMLPKDYLAYKMTGVDCTDVFESYECVGNLTKEAAQRMGLTENVKVIAGAGDNAAAAVGTGTVGDGKCNISLGTSGTIFISSDKFGVDDNNALHSFDHADGHFHLMGCMLSAASCNKWWMDEIIKTKEYSEEQKPITDDMLGNNRVFFLPYLMGERSPHNNPAARATFTGMTMDTDRTDMTQAVLEGVAFAIRDSFEVAKSLGINVTETKICGGGAKSPLWRKMIANILNIKVSVPVTEEGPALGAAMLAAVGTGAYKNVEEAASHIVKIKETIEPDKEIAARYEKKYQQFKKIYPALKSVFDEFD